MSNSSLCAKLNHDEILRSVQINQLTKTTQAHGFYWFAMRQLQSESEWEKNPNARKNKIINSKLVSNFKWLGWKKQRTKTYSFKKCVFVFVSHSLLLCASKALHVIHFTFCIDLLFLILRSIRHSMYSHGPFSYFNETESSRWRRWRW